MADIELRRNDRGVFAAAFAPPMQVKTLQALSSVSGSRGWWSLVRELSSGAWQRNEDVDVDTVLSNPTLFATLTLIAGDIGKCRPKLVQQDAEGIWTEVETASPFWPFLRKPNHYQTRIEFYEWWLVSKLAHGNTYVLKGRDARGVVTRGYILDPFRVKPLVAPDGSVFYQLIQDTLAQVEESVVVPAREIIHDTCCPLFHPLVGISPIYAAGFPAMHGLNIRNKSNKFFANGSQPGGVLTAPGAISQDTADRLKAYWDENFSGDNIGKTAVLGDGLTYQPMAVTAEAARLVEQLKMTDEDIAKCYHMPRHKVGIGPDPTYDNIEALNLQYYTDCLQVHFEKLELKLDEGLELTTVPGKTLGVEFDLDALGRMDTTKKADVASKAVAAGMSYNEVRQRYWDLGPVKGGEEPLAQQQYFTIAQLAERDAAPPPPVLPPASTTAAPGDDDDDDENDDAEEKGFDLVGLPMRVSENVARLRGRAL